MLQVLVIAHLLANLQALYLALLLQLHIFIHWNCCWYLWFRWARFRLLGLCQATTCSCWWLSLVMYWLVNKSLSRYHKLHQLFDQQTWGLVDCLGQSFTAGLDLVECRINQWIRNVAQYKSLEGALRERFQHCLLIFESDWANGSFDLMIDESIPERVWILKLRRLCESDHSMHRWTVRRSKIIVKMIQALVLLQHFVLPIPLSPFSVVVDPVHDLVLPHLTVLGDHSLCCTRYSIERWLESHLHRLRSLNS